jgi:hypothetical protein
MRRHDVTGPMDVERTERLLAVLASSGGAEARIIAKTLTHHMLVLRLDRDGISKTLMCGACDRIETDTRWKVTRLEYAVESTDPHRYRLVDRDARFRVVCGVIDVADGSDDWR